MGAAIGEMLAQIYTHALTGAKQPYKSDMVELGLVGAGIGGRFGNTSELNPKKYNEAMSGDNLKEWQKAVDEEHKKMVDFKVFQKVLKKDLPHRAKIMLRKANGTKQAQINAQGYEQVNGIHYDLTPKSAPVANEVRIQAILTLAVMANWGMQLLDLRGAVLSSRFEDDKQLYMEVSQGFEGYYGTNVVLLLIRTLYGTIHAAKQFWKQLLQAFALFDFHKSKADLCFYFKWEEEGLVVWYHG